MSLLPVALYHQYTNPQNPSSITQLLEVNVKKPAVIDVDSGIVMLEDVSVYKQNDPEDAIMWIKQLILLEEQNWSMLDNFAIRGFIETQTCKTCGNLRCNQAKRMHDIRDQHLILEMTADPDLKYQPMNFAEFYEQTISRSRRRDCANCKTKTVHQTDSQLCHGSHVILRANYAFEYTDITTNRKFDRIAENERWTLVGVAIHKGRTTNSGHYIACCTYPADPGVWYELDDSRVTRITDYELNAYLMSKPYQRVTLAVYRIDKLYQDQTPTTAEKPPPPPPTAEKPLPPPRFAFGTSTGESGASMVQRLMQKRGPGVGFEVAAEPKQAKPVVIAVDDEDAMDEESSSSIGGLIRRIRERMRV